MLYIDFNAPFLFLLLRTMPAIVAWLKYLSWFMFTNEALSIVQWQNVTDIQCSDDPLFPCLPTGKDVLTHYNFDENHFQMDISSMLVIYGIFHLLGMVSVIKRSRS